VDVVRGFPTSRIHWLTEEDLYMAPPHVLTLKKSASRVISVILKDALMCGVVGFGPFYI